MEDYYEKITKNLKQKKLQKKSGGDDDVDGG